MNSAKKTILFETEKAQHKLHNLLLKPKTQIDNPPPLDQSSSLFISSPVMRTTGDADEAPRWVAARLASRCESLRLRDCYSFVRNRHGSRHGKVEKKVLLLSQCHDLQPKGELMMIDFIFIWRDYQFLNFSGEIYKIPTLTKNELVKFVIESFVEGSMGLDNHFHISMDERPAQMAYSMLR